jgi:NADH-quinone oxidoreductase subunit G
MLAAARSGQLDALYLLGVDEVDVPAGAFVVYQGSHGDRGALRADVILPGAAYTEKSATYANTEGRVQMTQRAVFPPGAAKEDWTILRALSARLDKTLPYDDVRALRAAMYKAAPQLARLNAVGSPNAADDSAAIGRLAAVDAGIEAAPFALGVGDFYLTNPIARASTVMAELSAIKQALSARPAAAE